MSFRDITPAPVSDEQLEGYRAGVEVKAGELYSEHPTEKRPVITLEYGSKYVRVVSMIYGQRSVHTFIDRATGDILKSASWKAPAKHSRGTVHTPTFGVEFVGPYGAMYLK